MTGVSAETVLHTSDHWSAFYPEPRPCLADLLARGDFASIGALYADWNEYGMSDFGVSVQNWCVMPRLGRRLYLAIDAGPIYDDSGSLIAVVETVRDITAQHEQQRTLATLAAKDALTGLANRRTFDETLMAEVRRASRAGSPLSLLMLDVDCFKSFNDTYGHQRGDACLKAVAEAIQGAVKRAGDTVARYGGEEFSVILPDTDQSGAAITAQRIRRAVENLGLGHRGSSAAAVVTVSLGAATAVLDSLDAGELVKAADAALYCSKRAGPQSHHLVGGCVRFHVRLIPSRKSVHVTSARKAASQESSKRLQGRRSSISWGKLLTSSPIKTPSLMSMIGGPGRDGMEIGLSRSMAPHRRRPPVSPALLGLHDVQKWFGGVHALKGVDFTLAAGEVHVLLGENGAGKSTLMGVLSGAIVPDAGEIRIAGEPVRFASPRDAHAAGVAMIPQELDLVPGLDIAANLFLGNEITGAGVLQGRRMRDAAQELLAKAGSGPRRGAARLKPQDRRAAARRDRQGTCRRRPHPRHGRAIGRPLVRRGRPPHAGRAGP